MAEKNVVLVIKLLYIHLNTSNISNSIMDNAYLISNLLKISTKADIFLLIYIYSSNTDLLGFISCSITP